MEVDINYSVNYQAFSQSSTIFGGIYVYLTITLLTWYFGVAMASSWSVPSAMLPFPCYPEKAPRKLQHYWSKFVSHFHAPRIRCCTITGKILSYVKRTETSASLQDAVPPPEGDHWRGLDWHGHIEIKYDVALYVTSHMSVKTRAMPLPAAP